MKKIIIYNLFILCFNVHVYAQREYRQINAKLPGLGSQTMTVEVRGNTYIIDDDIVVKEDATGRGGVSTFDLNELWTNSVVPYTIDASLTGSMLKKLNDAISTVDTKTNICLRQKTSSDVNYIKFRMYVPQDSAKGSAADSPVGMQGGEQLIRIGTSATKGNLMHEILHSLGFYHEHMRSDRDKFITIHQNRMMPHIAHNKDGAFDVNFGKLSKRPFWDFFPGKDKNLNLSPYDFGSIMHYHEFAFKNATETKPTIEAKVKLPSGLKMGQRDSLSNNDIVAVNTLYPIVGNCTSSTSVKTTSASPSEPTDIGIVPLVPQSKSMSCWFAGVTMLWGWMISDGAGISLSESGIIDRLPSDLKKIFDSNLGLDPSDTRVFSEFGMIIEHPACYTAEGWRNMLIDYGPLLVASDVNGGAHFRVITGIKGDYTSAEGTIFTINDPWEKGMNQYKANNKGSTYDLTMEEFVKQYNTLGHKEIEDPGAVYVIHFPGSSN